MNSHEAQEARPETPRGTRLPPRWFIYLAWPATGRSTG